MKTSVIIRRPALRAIVLSVCASGVAKGVAKGLAALDRSRPTIVVGVSNGAVPALDLAQEARAGSVRGERLKGGAALN